MADSIPVRLAEFTPEDPTFRLVSTVMKAVPGSPDLVPYPALPAVVGALGGDPLEVAAASRHFGDEELGDVLWMSRLVDTGDRGYAVFTGVSSALKLFFGKKENRAEAFETDPQQRNDAVLKAFALAYLAWKAFPGTIPERTRTFTTMPAGRALLTYYAAIEVALPFADNALLASGRLFDDLLDKYGNDQLKRFTGLAGGRDVGQVGEVLSGLRGGISETIAKVTPYVDRIAGAVSSHAPGTMNFADKAAGVLANVADVLPVYRLLGSRLAAEGAVVRGREG